MYKFANPYLFFLIFPLIYLFFFRNKKGKGIKLPSIKMLKNKKISKKHLISKFFIFVSLILLVLALARPQKMNKNSEIKRSGIDIIVALDLSKSMLAKDFKPNRLEKAKEILKTFVEKRNGDRLGLVVFGGDAYTKVPLTFDHDVIKSMLSKITTDDITSNNETAIGMGLGIGINRMKKSNSKSKIIILLTDGENNSGIMSPEASVKLAKELKIKIYTVGIGAREIEIPTFFGSRKIANNQLDEPLLEYIAKETKGEYFRASDKEEFEKIFEKIDTLEKSDIDSKSFYQVIDLFSLFLKLSMIFLIIGLILQYLIFIVIP